MGYFDSAKNRTAWQKELTSLRAERARRAATGFAPGAAAKGFSENPHVKVISFSELENRVFETERKRAAERAKEHAQKKANTASAGITARSAEHAKPGRSNVS